MSCRPNHQTGVTLLELMITLTVLAMVIAIAVPASGKLIQMNQSKAVTQQLYRALQFTRAEAIKRGTRVVLCPLDRQTGQCTSNWNQSLAVFPDTNRDGTLPAPDAIVLETPPVPAGSLHMSPANRKLIRFDAIGYSPGSMGNLTYCPRGADTDPGAIRQLVLTLYGRVRWARDSDGDGVVEASGGSPVTCSGI